MHIYLFCLNTVTQTLYFVCARLKLHTNINIQFTQKYLGCRSIHQLGRLIARDLCRLIWHVNVSLYNSYSGRDFGLCLGGGGEE